MLDGELRRQKSLFAATDALAVTGALMTAWSLRDPSILRNPEHVEVGATIIVILVVVLL